MLVHYDARAAALAPASHRFRQVSAAGTTRRDAGIPHIDFSDQRFLFLYVDRPEKSHSVRSELYVKCSTDLLVL
jgi:hypothetical protein